MIDLGPAMSRTSNLAPISAEPCPWGHMGKDVKNSYRCLFRSEAGGCPQKWTILIHPTPLLGWREEGGPGESSGW